MNTLVKLNPISMKEYVKLCNETRPEGRALISNEEVMALYDRIQALEVNMEKALTCAREAKREIGMALAEPNPFDRECLEKNAVYYAGEAVKYLDGDESHLFEPR